MLAESCLKRGIDIPIYVTYFKKKEKVYIVDKPVKYSKLKEEYKTRDKISKVLLDRCNDLGKMTFEEDKNNKK